MLEALYPDDPPTCTTPTWRPGAHPNIHAGPEETHVFHLHAHQWLDSPGSRRNPTYLDSQTIRPGSRLHLRHQLRRRRQPQLHRGRLPSPLPPLPGHFAQGMWELWRNHDVFEAGTKDRNLPDAEIARGHAQPGLVPIPNRAMPPMPTYAETTVVSGRRREYSSGPPSRVPLLHRRPGRPTRAPGPAGPGAATAGCPATSYSTSRPRPGRRGATRRVRRGRLQARPQAAAREGTRDGAGGHGLPRGNFPIAGRRSHSTSGDRRGGPTRPTRRRGASGRTSSSTAAPPAPGVRPSRTPVPRRPPIRNYRTAYLQRRHRGTRIAQAGTTPRRRMIVLNEDVAADPGSASALRAASSAPTRGECVTSTPPTSSPRTRRGRVPDLHAHRHHRPAHPPGEVRRHLAPTARPTAGTTRTARLPRTRWSTRIAAANARRRRLRGRRHVGEQALRRRAHPAAHPRSLRPLGAQTTVQRWWADPLLDMREKPHTFGRSSPTTTSARAPHSTTGFYGGLLVEPLSPGEPVAGPEDGARLRLAATGAALPAGARTSDPATASGAFAPRRARTSPSSIDDGKPVNPPSRQRGRRCPGHRSPEHSAPEAPPLPIRHDAGELPQRAHPPAHRAQLSGTVEYRQAGPRRHGQRVPLGRPRGPVTPLLRRATGATGSSPPAPGRTGGSNRLREQVWGGCTARSTADSE